MTPQKTKGRTSVRSLEDTTLLLLVVLVSLAFAWNPVAVLRGGSVGGRAGDRVCAAPCAAFALHAEASEPPALATVLIILALVIVPLTLTAASLVQEAANFHESMQAGTWNLGDFFKQFLAVLPSWAIDLLDRLGLKDSPRCKRSCPMLSSRAARSLPQRRWISGLARSTSSSASASCCTCCSSLCATARGWRGALPMPFRSAEAAECPRRQIDRRHPRHLQGQPAGGRGARRSRRPELLVLGDLRAGVMGRGDGPLLFAARRRRGHRLVPGGCLFLATGAVW